MVNNHSFLHIYDRAYLALFEGKHTERMAEHMLSRKRIVVFMDSESYNISVGVLERSKRCFFPSSLITIYKFDKMVQRLQRRNQDHLLVFSTGSNKDDQVRVVFLIGCWLILSKSLDACQVYGIFDGIDALTEKSISFKLSVMHGWQALRQARSLAWLNFSKPFAPEYDDISTIDMEEFTHYSR